MKTNETTIGWLLLAVAGVVVGCGKEAAPKAEVPKSDPQTNRATIGTGAKQITALAPGTVLVIVDGDAFTRQDFDRTVAVRNYQLGANKKLTGAQRQATIDRVRQLVVPQFVNVSLLRHAALAQKVQPTDEDRKKLMTTLALFAKKLGKATPEQYLADAPGGEAFMRQELENQLLVNGIVRKVENAVVVPDEKVAAIIAEIQAKNDSTRKTNELQRAALVQIRKQLMDGDAFAALAEAHSESTRAGADGLWGEFERGEIEDRQLRKAIFGLATNTISEVVEAADGYHLIKVLEIRPPQYDADGVEVTGEVRVVAHIMKAKAALDPVPTADEVRVSHKRHLADKARLEFIEDLRRRAKIEYPNGTNFLGNATN